MTYHEQWLDKDIQKLVKELKEKIYEGYLHQAKLPKKGYHPLQIKGGRLYKKRRAI